MKDLCLVLGEKCSLQIKKKWVRTYHKKKLKKEYVKTDVNPNHSF